MAPVEPVTLARGEDSTLGQAVDCMRDLVAVCTLVRVEDSMQVLAAECMLAQAEAFTQGQEVGFMLARVVESILAHPQIMATKAHGGLASLEPKATNGLDKTVLNEASLGCKKGCCGE